MSELIINGKGLTTDFDSYIAERTLSNPKKKSIKQTVPFSNEAYDFSAIDGEVYYEERDLQYTIDIAEVSTTAMEQKRSDLLEWLYSVQNVDIFDPYLTGYHLKGSFESSQWSEDFNYSRLVISFKVYPYKIANQSATNQFNIGGNTNISVNNTSSHPIVPALTATASMSVTIGNRTYNIPSGTSKIPTFKLGKGANSIRVSGNGRLTISYSAEVL